MRIHSRENICLNCTLPPLSYILECACDTSSNIAGIVTGRHGAISPWWIHGAMWPPGWGTEVSSDDVTGLLSSRCDAVRYGSIDQSDLSISAGAHIGPIRWWFFFSVVKFGISRGLFSTRHPFNIVLEWMIIPHEHTSQTDTVTLFWKEGGIHCNPPHYSW